MNNTISLTVIAAIVLAATLVVGAGIVAVGNNHMAFAYQKKKAAARADGDGNGNTVINQVSKLGPNVLCTHPANNAPCLSGGSDNPGNSPVTVTVPITNTNTNDNSASSSSSSEATASNTNDITNSLEQSQSQDSPLG
jgi:hypothetical protein